MRIGVDVAAQRMPFAEVVDRTRFAEGLGYDGVWGFDHFQPMYGEGPGECFEAYTTMAALAMVTERVRLGLLVTGLTYRPLGLLATEAITIDHASNGRLEEAIEIFRRAVDLDPQNIHAQQNLARALSLLR